jgi:hypothetical protein
LEELGQWVAFVAAKSEQWVGFILAEFWQWTIRAIAWAKPYWRSIYDSWLPANWIAVAAAALSFLMSLYALVLSGRRERKKNRREEFHRRIASPIENALGDFAKIGDTLERLRIVGAASPEQLDELLIEAKIQQRKLSTGLRRASDSKACSSKGWDLGSQDYDDFIDAIETARLSPDDLNRDALSKALGAIERQNDAIARRIEAEFGAYM